MDKVVDFPSRGTFVERRDDQANPEFDQFLIDEGLELLAAYRSIRDDPVRLSLLCLLRKLAREQEAKSLPAGVIRDF